MSAPRKKILKYAAITAGVFIFINFAAYIDVTMRAKSAYMKGMMYLGWLSEPSAKKAALDEWLASAKSRVKEKNPEEKKLIFKSLDMQYKMRMDDDDAKNAYFWFKTAVDCFQPPRSKYVKLAEEEIKTNPALKGWRGK